MDGYIILTDEYPYFALIEGDMWREMNRIEVDDEKIDTDEELRKDIVRKIDE